VKWRKVFWSVVLVLAIAVSVLASITVQAEGGPFVLESRAGESIWTCAVAGYSTRLYVDEAYDPNLVSMEVNFGDGTSGTSTEWWLPRLPGHPQSPVGLRSTIFGRAMTL